LLASPLLLLLLPQVLTRNDLSDDQRIDSIRGVSGVLRLWQGELAMHQCSTTATAVLVR
jgi:hypothetical protein